MLGCWPDVGGGDAGRRKRRCSSGRETERRVRDLVRQLSDDQWKKRDAAEKELVALGPDVESLLREMARQISEPEASARLKMVIAELASRRWTGPTRVTLRLKDAPPRQVYEELFRQAGAEFTVHPLELLDPNAARRGFDDQPGEPFALAWELPVKTQELVVPVAFEDLPLP